MRNVRGFDAIELAEEYDITLYDLYLKNELTVHEAMQFVDSQRDPQSFALLNWPDTDEEAEQIVLTAYEQALRNDRMLVADLEEVIGRTATSCLHPYAAEVAAERLVEKGILDADRGSENRTVYSLMRIYYIKSEFLESISEGVCEACASALMEGPFHKICLEQMLTNLSDSLLSVDSVATIEPRRLPVFRYDKLAERLRPGIGLLSKTVSGTKTRWQSVLKPILSRGEQKAEQDTSSSSPNITQQIGFESDGTPHRERMTKSDLIAYLQSIEILDDSGEVARLQDERSKLLDRLDAKERRIAELDRERDYWEGQFAELSRDMRTMIDAMEIAKRRSGHDTVAQGVGNDSHRESNALTD